MNRYLCIHLHFYQPPRENPWLDEIEYQESAYPFHDWNEKISVECYRSNGASLVLDSEGRVVDLSNNYAKTSFNFGPTLLSWMEEKDPQTYEKILEGDRLSQTNFGGHGSAIAQCYNHIIMPLAHRRDKETQVIWGLKDFERRFRRTPESMWLPETAVDIESLEILSDHGMKYVILAPRQAKAVRSLDEGSWQDVSGERVDPRQPYLVRLPSGRTIVAFFYNGAISKSVAFEGLLHNGETFANRLMSGFGDELEQNPKLLHIATDGETYGHHHKQGDMALAYAIAHLERNHLALITNYGQYLELNPPQNEVQIREYSSWSCEHGVGRWREDCGCSSGRQGEWHQRWRQPLRQAVDQLRDQMEAPFENTMKTFVKDPWAMRNDYIRVINDRSLGNIEDFLGGWCEKTNLSDSEVTLILKALESQRHLMLMFTSCAWFFDEVSGIETIQNLQYAYRALELGEAAFGVSLEESFMKVFETAESNLPELGSGRTVFERYVKPAKVDNVRVGIHFAIASIFETFGEMNEVYNNKITLIEFSRVTSGKASLACGRARIRSRVSLERQQIIFGVIHLGDHNVSAGVKSFENEEEYQKLVNDSEAAFNRADFPETMRVIDRIFASHTYSLRDLFRDEQKRITDFIMKEAMQATEERFRRLYDNNYPLLCYLSDIHLAIPKVFSDIAEFVENRSLRKTLTADGRVNTKKIRRYLSEAKKWGTQLDSVGLVHDIEIVLHKKMKAFMDDQTNPELLEEILELVKLESELPSELNLGPIQNWFLQAYKVYMKNQNRNIQIQKIAQALGNQLRVKLPDPSELEEIHVKDTNGANPSEDASLDLSDSVTKGIQIP